MNADSRGHNGLSKRQRLFSSLSVLLFSVLVMGYLWWGKFDYNHALWSTTAYVGAIALVVGNHLYHRDQLSDLGIRWDNFRVAALRFGIPTLCALFPLVVLGSLYGNLRYLGLTGAATYLVWAALQQHLLQNFLRRRSQEVLSPAKPGSPKQHSWKSALPSALMAAALFSIFHLANFGLMLFTFAAGVAWCLLFARTPNLFWATLSQAVLAVALASFFKFDFLDQFSVGRPGYRYDFYGGGVRVGAGFDAGGNPFVATLPGPEKGVPALVRVFDERGKLLREWTAFEHLDFSGELAVGDLGYDPGDEIVVAPGPGSRNPPKVRVFNSEGRQLAEFKADSLTYGFGLWVSVACGRIYVSPGPAPRAPQTVLEFSPSGQLLNQWDFPGLGLVNGVRATAYCAQDPSQDQRSLLLWGTDVSVNPSTVFWFDIEAAATRPIDTIGTTFGIQATLLKINSATALAAAPGPLRGYPPLVYVLDLEESRLFEFAGEPPDEVCGATIAAVDTNADGVDELVLGDGTCPDQPAMVRIYTVEGKLTSAWNAYPE